MQCWHDIYSSIAYAYIETGLCKQFCSHATTYAGQPAWHPGLLWFLSLMVYYWPTAFIFVLHVLLKPELVYSCPPVSRIVSDETTERVEQSFLSVFNLEDAFPKASRPWMCGQGHIFLVKASEVGPEEAMQVQPNWLTRTVIQSH